MPSAFSHAISAVALGYAFKKNKGSNRMIVIGALCSVLPDADALSFQFGIPYSSMWGHRGISHSFFFAFLLSLFVVFTFYRWMKTDASKMKLFWYFFLATASHPILDAFTNGGLGVAFFAPFNNDRYFFPFHPIKVSPISISRFFTERGLEVFKSELLWIWLPCLLWMISLSIIKKNKTLI